MERFELLAEKKANICKAVILELFLLNVFENYHPLFFMKFYHTFEEFMALSRNASLFFFIFYLWWILSYIEMKQPWVYMCSPSQSPLPPPSPPVPSRCSQCTRSERLSHASNLGW